jgi:hypothetical protein
MRRCWAYYISYPFNKRSVDSLHRPIRFFLSHPLPLAKKARYVHYPSPSFNMPSVKLLFTLLSLAVFNISFNPLPTYALTLERDHMARSFNFAHAGLANKKRDGKSKRCRHRAGSGPSVSSSSQTPDTAPTSTPQPQPPAAKTTSSPVATHSPAAAAPASNGNRKVGLAWSNHEEENLCKFTSPKTQ